MHIPDSLPGNVFATGIASGFVGLFASVFDYFNVQNVSNVVSVLSIAGGAALMAYQRYRATQRTERTEDMKEEITISDTLIENQQKLVATILDLQKQLIERATPAKEPQSCPAKDETKPAASQ